MNMITMQDNLEHCLAAFYQLSELLKINHVDDISTLWLQAISKQQELLLLAYGI